jgi:hypothetical protein
MDDPLRYEVKLVLDAFQLGQVRSWVYAHSNAFGIAYPARQVNNIYFDTLDSQFLADHLDGVYARLKFRYRWYGNTWQLGGGQLEIKKKMGKVGKKDVYPFTGNLDITQGSWREIVFALRTGTRGLPPEIDNLFRILQPTLINQYQREYYLSRDGLIRLTLDYQMQAYDQGFGLRPNLRYSQPSRSSLVMEMKAAKKDHQSIADTLAEFPQRCCQHSKYLSGLDGGAR